MNWWGRYVGVPFEDGGRGPDSYDCWGLVRAVYANELGIDLPSYGEISAREMARVARMMKVGADEERWRPVERPRALDVVLMRHPRASRVAHVGVMIDHDRLMHVEAATNVAIVPVSHFSIASRIAGFRRYDERSRSLP